MKNNRNEPVRVLQIIKSLGRGGAETLLVETLNLHDRRSFEFHYIYFLPWKNQLVEGLTKNGGKVTCVPARNNLFLVLRFFTIIRYVRKNKIKLIHAHLPWAGLVARIVGKFTGVPVLYTEHNKQERYHFGTRFLNLLTMNMVDVVIPVSNDVEGSIRKNKRNLRIRLQTILNGVNIEHFKPDQSHRTEIRKQLGIPESALVVVTIAVFRFQKRLDLWLEIASKIAGRNSNTHFIIVGDGPLKEMLHLKCRELDMTAKTHFVGLQTEVRPYLAAADVYMMSSIFEGLPIALLEAMSFGLPVMSTDAGGIKEVIRHETDGLLCSVDEPQRLVEFASRFADNPKLLATMGQSARSRIITNFSLEKMVEQLQDLYYTFTN